METRLKLMLIGTIIAIFGFAFAFSSQNEEFIGMTYYERSYLTLIQIILGSYPNLISGVIIGIGGITISSLGFFFARESKSFERAYQDCGQKLDKNEKYCHNCGAHLSSANSK